MSGMEPLYEYGLKSQYFLVMEGRSRGEGGQRRDDEDDSVQCLSACKG